MWLFPYEQFSIISDLSPKEAQKRLNAGFEKNIFKKISLFKWNKNIPKNTFYFIPFFKGTNSFVPMIRCFIKAGETTGTSKIYIRLKMHPIVLLFPLWIWIISSIIIDPKTHPHITSILTPYIVVISVYVFFLLMYNYEAQKAKEKLDEIFFKYEI
jgi:hypothetical protein